jgi:D-serine deaminase-like pyridoxal phosphate-dependent protein
MEDHARQHYASYIGKPVAELPTPSLVLSLPLIKKNIDALHQDVADLGIAFRPHVKTLKTTEITRMMLVDGKSKAIAVSTLAEIRGAWSLVEEGLINECLYAFPISAAHLPELARFRTSVKIILLVDHEDQVSALEAFNGTSQPWDVFIKLDVGSRRAGVAAGSPALRKLTQRAEQSSAVDIYGFYCHANHSYGGHTREEAEATLNKEVTSVLDAAALLPESRELVISIGATPTAHVVKALVATELPKNLKLELHAGNFPCNDLQQVSTSLVPLDSQAARVAVDVCSVYPERNEALVNAGAVALSRETSPGFPGFGRVVGRPAWSVARLSQEHGILTPLEGSEGAECNAEKDFRVGERLYLYCNHVCITAAAFFVYFVVDENDVVQDAWIPWKGW